MVEPPAGARDDVEIICEIARRLGCDFGQPTAEQVWDECRSLSPMHAGMKYARLDELARSHELDTVHVAGRRGNLEVSASHRTAANNISFT